MLLAQGHRAIRVAGADNAAWLEALWPHLDGTNSEEAIVEGLPVERAQRVRDLLSLLVKHGYARDVARDAPHGLSQEQRARFASQIAYLEAHVDSPEARLERFVHSRVTVVGRGEIARLVCTLLRQQGARGVRWWPKEWPNAGRGGVDAVPQHLSGPVLYVSETGSIEQMRALAAACDSESVPLISAFFEGGDVWVGPYPGDGACWECLVRRINTSGRASAVGVASRYPGKGSGGELPHTIATSVASVLCFETFSAVTQCHAALLQSKSAMHVRMDTLNIDRHPYTNHPDCHRCAARALLGDTRRGGVRRAPKVRGDELVARATAGADARLGLVRQLTERDLPQFPFCMTKVELNAPSRRGDGASRIVIGVAQTAAAARIEAILRAMEVSQRECGPVDCGATWALDHRLRWTLVQRQATPGLAASGAGLSWEEAVCRSLFNLAIRLAERQGSRGTELRTAALLEADDIEVVTLVSTLRQLGIEWRAVELETPLRIGVLKVEVAGRPIAMVAHTRPTARFIVGMRCAAAAHALSQVGSTSDSKLQASSPVWSLGGSLTQRWATTMMEVKQALSHAAVLARIEQVRPDPGFGDATPFFVRATLSAGSEER